GADIFIGVSSPDIVTIEMLKTMARNPIVFALSNPNPEIDPFVAEPYVTILATGRSDYQNQVNNALCFPGFFKGLLDCNAKTITYEMKVAAAESIASVIADDELSEDYIIPSIFDERVADHVAKGVVKAAIETGVARRKPK
ncbi:MAG: NAD-dependent malic enzyme, partial [Thermodesulfobacteriota bacterium]